MQLNFLSEKPWITAVLATLIFAVPFFFIGGPSYSSGPLFRALWDCGHPAFFFGLVVYINSRYSVANWRRVFLVSVFVFILGGAIEIIQAHTGRDGNWRDLLRDLSGTWIALFWLQAPNKWIWIARVMAMMLLVPDLNRVALEASVKVYKEYKFPMIAGFESPLETYSLGAHVSRITHWRTEGNSSLAIVFNRDQYSGISIRRISGDWNAYQTLVMDIYNPDTKPLDITLRINDLRHDLNGSNYSDRFNKKITLATGLNHLSFSVADIAQAPEKRKMDLAQVNCIVLFATRLPAAREIYLDNLHLE